MTKRGRNISWIEKYGAKLGIVPEQDDKPAPVHKPNKKGKKKNKPSQDRLDDGRLAHYPPFSEWSNWTELDSKRQVKNYSLIPTTCFNCEAACGLLAYVDKATGNIDKFEGNPRHPGSRGRNCAKGPATVNQVYDPERILKPQKRAGERGSGNWIEVSWDEALDDIAGRIRKALLEERHHEIMYHVGRPGHEGFIDRMLTSWGVDGHNSHTNICSSSARLGYQMSVGYDRPSPDYEHANLIILISAHLESGHYFNPHAQRIIDAKNSGARVIVFDPRLSNSAARADLWIPLQPGTEAIVILAALKLLLAEGQINHKYIADWVDWRGFLKARHPDDKPSVEQFLLRLEQSYDEYTPEAAAKEAGITPEQIQQLADEIGKAGNRIACHVWRSACTGNEYGWQVARCLSLLVALTGSFGVKGGTGPHGWNKFKPKFWNTPKPIPRWNELQWPREFPLSFYEMSILLPHFLREKRGKLDTYFTRVYNPIWTNPDGFQWLEALKDEDKIGCHIALTPTWNETAFFADYVLPMGHAPERHDIQSQETHAAIWLSFRQPVLRRLAEQRGEKPQFSYETNPGEVWEEDEFWIELTWRIDPDGKLGIRQYYESPYRPGEKVRTDEYYRWIFENSVPGLPEAAEAEGMTPYEYMCRVGAFEVKKDIYELYRDDIPEAGVVRKDEESGLAYVDDECVGVIVDGKVCSGFPTPSKRIEVHSETLAEWGFEDHAIPKYSKSHVAPENIDPENGIYTLLPTYRIPTMIHTRSGNSKWLNEISHSNPVLMNPETAARHQIETGDLVKVATDIGWFINRALVTEGLRPGVIACSHHMGRWRLESGPGSRWNSATVKIEELDEHVRRLRIQEPTEKFESTDPDSDRIWWAESGVNQNMCFGVNPDPASGMHAWHQIVTLSKADNEDRYGDVVVDLRKSTEHYEKWMAKTKAAKAGSLRRPLWLPRPLHPTPDTYQIPIE